VPDQYALNNAGAVTEAKGVLPGVNSYEPLPSLSEYTTTAIATVCKGAVAVTTTAGARTIFAGTATKLYKFAGAASAWTDVTRSSGGDYSVPADEFWQFTQFGNNLIAVNSADNPQTINITSGSNFALLGGSPPRARYSRVISDHLFFGGLSTGENLVRWSGVNDAAFWTVGQQDADFQEFADGGNVKGITPLTSGGLIFQDDAVRRVIPQNSRAIFALPRIEAARGLKAPYSLGLVGGLAIYWGGDGFYSIGPEGGSAPIGFGGVDDWFSSVVNLGRLGSIVSAVDPIRRRVIWLFPTAGNSSTALDHLLAYDMDLKKFTHAEVSASFIFPAAVPGISLEGLDNLGYTMETLPFSLDSSFLQGGTPYLGAFNTSNKLAFFNGANQAARLTSSGMHLIPGRRSYVNGCVPFTDAQGVTISVGKKERPQDTGFTYGAEVAINAQGLSPQRSSARIHRFRLNVAAGETWTHIQGLDPIFTTDGDR